MSTESHIEVPEGGAKIVPGKPILILLLILAQGDEKPPLVKALGLRDDDETQRGFEGALASLLEYERQAARSNACSASNLCIEKLRPFHSMSS